MHIWNEPYVLLNKNLQATIYTMKVCRQVILISKLKAPVLHQAVFIAKKTAQLAGYEHFPCTKCCTT